MRAPHTDDGSATPRVAGGAKGQPRRRGRNGSRTKSQDTLRRIQARARERQAAWAETGQPNTTERLTSELDGLYGDYRDENAGTLTDPFYGRTMGMRS